MTYILLLVALSLSAVAAWYAIVGLMAIFAAASTPIMVMGILLGAAKLVIASWLYRNWTTSPFFLKTYLTIAVIVLMFISSMGIFGFLSRAHIEQTLNINTGSADQIEIINNKIEEQIN